MAMEAYLRSEIDRLLRHVANQDDWLIEANRAAMKEIDRLASEVASLRASPINKQPEAEEAQRPSPTNYVDELKLDYGKAQAFVRNLPMGKQLTGYEIIFALVGRVPDETSARRVCTNFLERLDGLVPAPATKGTGRATRQTAWGSSRVYERSLLLTDYREDV